MKIKVSHEVPLCLLDKSLSFNDYDYCLPHLMDESETYRKFFLNASEKNRHIMMDNSLHELGNPYKEDRLFHWLEELMPNEFFIPDFWENKEQSIQSAKNWIKFQEEYSNTTFIAVVQAKDYYEAAECYQIYKEIGYKKIAFSYGAEYYCQGNFFHPNKTLGKALGRIRVISTLYKLGAIKETDKIHLLGCSVPQEFGWYKDFPFIESIDTSNPVMAALDGMKYKSYGLYEKPKSNMNDSLYKNEYLINMTVLDHNIQQFRAINNL